MRSDTPGMHIHVTGREVHYPDDLVAGLALVAVQLEEEEEHSTAADSIPGSTADVLRETVGLLPDLMDWETLTVRDLPRLGANPPL
jgi:hypothetical protein